jgi:hypothetical protein
MLPAPRLTICPAIWVKVSGTDSKKITAGKADVMLVSANNKNSLNLTMFIRAYNITKITEIGK